MDSMNNKQNRSRTLRGFLKFSLSTKGLSIDDLAKMHDMTGSSLCIAFYRPFPKAEWIIADALNQQPWDLWPERYTDQKPNRFNSWYRRKFGDWKPKIAQKNLESRRNILNEDRDEANK